MTARAAFEPTSILTLANRVGRAIDNERRKLTRERGPDVARATPPIPGVAGCIGYDDGFNPPSWTLVAEDGAISTFWGKAPSA